MFFLPVTLAALFLLSSASAQCITGNDVPNYMFPTEVKKSQFEFALDTLNKTVQIEPNENIIYSPHSLHQALTLAYVGARGTTEAALRKALHLSDNVSKIELLRHYSVFNTSTQQTSAQNVPADYEYSSANRLWISNSRQVEECMEIILPNQLETTDFRTNPSAVKDRINEWVSNMTKGHIRDLLSPDSITEDTDLVLANAVYFKGPWLSRFDVANSKKELFYVSHLQPTRTTFMRQEGNFNHYKSDELGAYVLELPYKGENVSMFILLPPYVRSEDNSTKNTNSPDGIRLLIERILTEDRSKELWELFNSGIPSQQVEVIIPRFELEKELPMGRLLHEIGAGELMMPNKADLRGFVKDGAPLSLGDAVHRAKIEVSEEGTTAAAATALYSFRSGRPLEPSLFRANHPFLYFIYDKPNSAILFAGVFRKPSGSQNNA